MEVDDDIAGWIDEAAGWWLRELGPIGSTLALPIDEHFPDRAPPALLAAVLRIAGMEEWTFELVDESDAEVADPLANVPRPLQPAVVRAPEADDARPVPAGGPFPIPYTQDDARDPARMIALLARGASHYLLGSAAEAPTETEEHDEAYVEIGAVMLGFGVFLANAAFEFEQFDDGAMQGWRYASQGVLGQDALGYALALFVELAEVEQKPAIAHLAPNARAAFKWARSQLQGRRRHVVDGLRDVARVPDGDGPYR